MKILLVDDHEMVRLGLKSYFDLQDDVEVVGEASNGSQGIDLALELRQMSLSWILSCLR